MISVQNVYDKFLLYKKNLGDVSTELFLDWCDELNRFAYRILYGEDPNRFLSVQTIIVTANTDTYALNSDFLNISPIGAGVYVNNGSTTFPIPLTATGYGSQIPGYYISGTNIIFTPLPQSTQTILVRYIPILPTLTAFTDELIIPDDFIAYVRYAIDVLYDEWDEDVSAEGIADGRYARALDELARNLRQDTGVIGLNGYSASGGYGYGLGSGYNNLWY